MPTKGITDRTVHRLRSAWLAVAFYLFLSLLAVAPVLAGYSMLGGDTIVHTRWQVQFAPTVWNGILYPRWLPNMTQGFGSPAFFFYPPMLQWLGSLFWPIFPGAQDAITRLCLAIALASTIGAIGCRRWLRVIGLEPGLAGLGGLVFLLMPYRLFVDFYQRGALAELVGMCAMPWLMAGVVRIKADPRGGWPGYAVAVAAIAYCHLPAALMGVAMSSAYVLVLSGGRDMRILGSGAAGTLAGMALAAPCILPALGLLGWLPDTTAMFGARNQPTNWLLFSGTAWVDPAMQLMTLALCAASLVSAAVMAAIGWREASPSRRTTIAFLLAVIVVVAILNTQATAWFWAWQTPLSRIQFPFRLLSLQALALAGLAALAIAGCANRVVRRLLWLAPVALVVFNAGLIAYQHGRDSADGQHPQPIDLADTTDTSEYVLGQTTRAASSITIAPLTTGYRHLSYALDAKERSDLPLHQFAFTGWECRIDGQDWQPAGHLPPPASLATCPIPAGHHRLEARLKAPTAERWGNGIGLAAAIVLIADVIMRRRRRSRRADRASAGRADRRQFPQVSEA